jgi:hypothetical protein
VARIRTVKPEFWVDEKVVELTFGARLLFIGLWSFADDQGYVDYSPKRIRMQVFPGDQVDIEALIGELLAAGVVRAYESPVGPVLHVANWARHQRVDKAGKARFDPDELRPFPSAPVAVPAPSPSPREESREVQEPSGSPREDSGRASRVLPCGKERIWKGREGKGTSAFGGPRNRGSIRPARHDQRPHRRMDRTLPEAATEQRDRPGRQTDQGHAR